MLRRVTLTGADDSVEPGEVLALGHEYPFVELGILVGSQEGKHRFPSAKWLMRFADIAARAKRQVALHVCGKILDGILKRGECVCPYLGAFERMQLNFHGEPANAGGHSLEEHPDARVAMDRKKVFDNIVAAGRATGVHELIVQLDGVNNWILDGLVLHGIRASGLYDVSHGSGTKPAAWPTPNVRWKIGFAGGIGPETIAEDLAQIAKAAGRQDFWIDMESNLYTDR